MLAARVTTVSDALSGATGSPLLSTAKETSPTLSAGLQAPTTVKLTVTLVVAAGAKVAAPGSRSFHTAVPPPAPSAGGTDDWNSRQVL